MLSYTYLQAGSTSETEIASKTCGLEVIKLFVVKARWSHFLLIKCESSDLWLIAVQLCGDLASLCNCDYWKCCIVWAVYSTQGHTHWHSQLPSFIYYYTCPARLLSVGFWFIYTVDYTRKELICFWKTQITNFCYFSFISYWKLLKCTAISYNTVP